MHLVEEDLEIERLWFAAFLAFDADHLAASFGDQANKGFVGPRTDDFTKNYAGTRAEVERLTASIDNLFAKITQQSAQLNGTQSSLLKLSATSEAVAQGPHGDAPAARRA